MKGNQKMGTSLWNKFEDFAHENGINLSHEDDFQFFWETFRAGHRAMLHRPKHDSNHKYYVLYEKKQLDNPPRILRIPRVTVCLVRDDDVRIHRGISICSDNDPFDYKEGRRWAKKYAHRAMNSGKLSGKIESPLALRIIKKLPGSFPENHKLPSGYKCHPDMVPYGELEERLYRQLTESHNIESPAPEPIAA